MVPSSGHARHNAAEMVYTRWEGEGGACRRQGWEVCNRTTVMGGKMKKGFQGN